MQSNYCIKNRPSEGFSFCSIIFNCNSCTLMCFKHGLIIGMACVIILNCPVMMHSGYGYLDFVDFFFFGRDSSLLARYDSALTFSWASLFLNSFAFFCKIENKFRMTSETILFGKFPTLQNNLTTTVIGMLKRKTTAMYL